MLTRAVISSFPLICCLTPLFLSTCDLSVPLFLPFLDTASLSRFLALINSTGLPSDAFQAPSSYHRPGLCTRPQGYLLSGLKLRKKEGTFFTKDQDSSSSELLIEGWITALSPWSLEEGKLFYLLDKDTAAFTKPSPAVLIPVELYCILVQNKQDRVSTYSTIFPSVVAGTSAEFIAY